MTLLLVDANNLAMRSLHAMARSGLSADGGVPTGPLLAFINGLSMFVRDEQPEQVVVCWDGGRSEHRVMISPEYKAHRLTPQSDFQETKESVFSLAKEFCTLANVFQVERPGVEADDLIAYYCRERKPGVKVVIISSDKDFQQLLVDGQVEQVRLSSAGAPTDRWTAARVMDESNCQPEQLRYAMALAGDVSDNVIGVPRFGMKTAIKALAKYDFDFDKTLEDERISPHANIARMNLRLVDLVQPLGGLTLPEVPSFQPTRPGGALFEPLLTYLIRYRMKSIQTRFYAGTLWV